MNPVFIRVVDVLTEVSLLMNDAGKVRWTQSMIDTAYNVALEQWGNRLSIPVVYDSTNSDLPASWSSGTSTYDLPAGLHGASMQPQYKRSVLLDMGVPSAGNPRDIWTDLHSYTILPPSGGNGKFQLQLNRTPPDAPLRIVAMLNNMRIGVNTGGIVMGNPELTTSVGGYMSVETWPEATQGFIKIGDEIIGFCGLIRGTSGVGGIYGSRLQNLVRNADYRAVTPAAHTAGTAVYPVLALEDSGDRAGFVETILATCHRMYLNNVSAGDAGFHQQMVTYYDNRVQQFMRSRSTQRRPKFILTEFATME